MAELKHCDKCGMTAAHIDGACQRCAFIKAHPKRPRKPMTDDAKARLAEANERRKKEREARRRDAQTTNTEEN
jgi:predicted ATP-dependent serine protease